MQKFKIYFIIYLYMKNVIYNFCESIINNNNPPELLNSISSLGISIIPLFIGLPKKSIILRYIGYIFILTGISSSYYHYNLNWIGKQADELCMLFLNLLGNIFLIKHIFKKNIYKIFFNILNIIIFITLLILNLKIKNVLKFPKYYLIYSIFTIYLVIKYTIKNKLNFLKNLLLSLLGFMFWIISEKFCNNYTFIGHSIWHILFPLGIYLIILNIDKNLDANN